MSNFDVDQLAELLQVATRVRPALVQRNSDPFSSDRDARAFCAAAGIQYQVPVTPSCLRAMDLYLIALLVGVGFRVHPRGLQ